MTSMPITVACLDMAGTTVADDGSVIAAFSAAVEQFGLPEGTQGYDDALAYVRQTMGQSKIEVFRHVLGAEDAAQQANAAFEEHYARSVRAATSSRCRARPRPSPRCGRPGSRCAWPPGSRRRQGTPCSTRSAGGRWSTWCSRPPMPAVAVRGPTCRSPRCCGSAGERSASSPSPGTRQATSSPGCGPGRPVAGVLTGSSTREELEQAKTPVILDTIACLLPLVNTAG